MNPNTDKREVVLDLSPNGEVMDLGVDEAAAIDLSSKSPRFAKLSILERGVSIVTILRTQMEHGSIKVIPKSLEFVSTDWVMRSIAMGYLISLMLFLTGFLSGYKLHDRGAYRAFQCLRPPRIDRKGLEDI